MEPPVSAYVQRADGNAVQVSLLDETPRAALLALGFRGQGGALQRGLLAGPFLPVAWQGPDRFEITRG